MVGRVSNWGCSSLLRAHVAENGAKMWFLVSEKLTGRIGKHCRERWTFLEQNPDFDDYDSDSEESGGDEAVDDSRPTRASAAFAEVIGAARAPPEPPSHEATARPMFDMPGASTAGQGSMPTRGAMGAEHQVNSSQLERAASVVSDYDFGAGPGESGSAAASNDLLLNLLSEEGESDDSRGRHDSVASVNLERFARGSVAPVPPPAPPAPPARQRQTSGMISPGHLVAQVVKWRQGVQFL